jgi:hypothetical protein
MALKKFMRGFPLFFLCVLFLFEMRAQGSNFFITDTNDDLKTGTFRRAIIHANEAGGKNTILLGQASKKDQNGPQLQWIFRLTLSGADEDAARTGDLDVKRGKLTIIGAGSNVVIDATGLGDRVFQVLTNAELTLSNLVIRGGIAPQAEFGSFYSSTKGAEKGGAIYNAGLLTLKNCIITNNSSGGGNGNPGNGGGTEGGDGGGIYSSGTLIMYDCVVVGNLSGAGVDGASGGNGGGIKNDGTSLLTDCIISGNQNSNGGDPAGNAFGAGGWGGSGGGIFNSGTMVLNRCIISANVGGQGSSGGSPGIGSIGSPGGWGGNGGSGAGIYNAGQMHLNFSSVFENISGSGGNGGSFGSGGNAGTGGNGAGIFNTGKLSLNTTTISDNLCGYGGSGGAGGFGGVADGGAGGSGGGVCNGGSLDLTSCTIALNQTGVGGKGGNTAGGFNNSSAASSGGQGGTGGGILNAASNTHVVVRNTLIALNLINVGGGGGTNTAAAEQTGNSGAEGIGFDLAGDFTSQRYNLIGKADGSTGFFNSVNADQVGSVAAPIDPLIGPLQMNGGLTFTHALLPGSAAIDKGKSFGIMSDQRGHHRPYDFISIPNAPGGDGSDIGALEMDN